MHKFRNTLGQEIQILILCEESEHSPGSSIHREWKLVATAHQKLSPEQAHRAHPVHPGLRAEGGGSWSPVRIQEQLPRKAPENLSGLGSPVECV